MNTKERSGTHTSFFLLIFISVIIVALVFCYPTYHKYRKQLKEKNQLIKILDQKKLESSKLLKERNDLKTNPREIEKVAREVFGYCREGETVMIYETNNSVDEN